MQRSVTQVRRDIDTIPYEEQFRKCKESSPIGYKFLSNIPKREKEVIDSYVSYEDYIVLPDAYNMYNERIDDYVSVHRKIK